MSASLRWSPWCVLALLSMGAPDVRAQINWTSDCGAVPGPGPYGMTFDVGRGTAVLLGGYPGLDTWEYAGTWSYRASSGPPQRGSAALAYDVNRARTVLFSGGSAADTWEWDGTVWRQAAAGGPAARAGHASAYDFTGVLVHGGRVTGAMSLSDTWRWDGTNWSQLGSAGPSVQLHAMAYDTARGRTVLFGGLDAATGALQGATWEWDGTSWLRRTPATSPSPRRSAPLAYDLVRGRVVLFGGYVGGNPGVSGETWEWDGTQWQQRFPTSSPPARYEAQMVYDLQRGVCVLFGGWVGTSGYRSDTWEWDGTNWRQIGGQAAALGRQGHGLTYDSARARHVLFGGSSTSGIYLADLWESDGVSCWQRRTFGVGPAARSECGFAFDPVRGRSVLFGGAGTGSARLADTWEWDGSGWTRSIPAASPSARSGCRMAFDPNRGHVLLVGGNDGTNWNNETWEWTGTTWNRLAVTTTLQPVDRPVLATDEWRARVVLFDAAARTFEWDGTSWALRASSGPSVRACATGAFDGQRGRVVLFGGVFMLGSFADTWEWDGVRWNLITPSVAPPPRSCSAMTWDPPSERGLLVGGASTSPPAVLSDMWSYRSSWPARYAPFGTGCAGSLGAPRLRAAANTQPWLGDPLTVRVDQIPPTAFAALIFGRSQTSWGGVPLPLSLAGLGMPGCALLVDPVLTTPMANVRGSAELSLTVPADLALLAVTLFHQGVVADAQANAAGLVVSNGAACTFGRR
jgi:hypothetical protein